MKIKIEKALEEISSEQKEMDLLQRQIDSEDLIMDHVKKRMQERYGIEITTEQYWNLCNASMVTLEKRSKKVFTVFFNFKGFLMIGVYCFNKKRMLTVLPIACAYRHIRKTELNKKIIK